MNTDTFVQKWMIRFGASACTGIFLATGQGPELVMALGAWRCVFVGSNDLVASMAIIGGIFAALSL